MKHLAIILALLLSFNMAACGTDDNHGTEIPGNRPDETEEENSEENKDENNLEMVLIIKTDEAEFTAVPADNVSVDAFKELLPVTVTMRDLNNNEKYCYLPQSLPTAAHNPGTIRNGDLMLFGSDCFVIFYKTFTSGYSYTRLGTIENPSGLERALGTGNVTVTIELREKE